MVKRRAKNKMMRSYTHSDVRNAFPKSAAKPLTLLHAVIKRACIFEFEAGLITTQMLSSELAVLTISTLKYCQFLLIENRH